MTQHLYLFTIGPVQSFIAAARRTQDLYVGSAILAQIAKVGIKSVPENAELLFPVPNLDTSELPDSVSHRFAFRVDVEAQDPKIKQIGQTISDAMKNFWLQEIASPMFEWLSERVDTSKCEDLFYEQVENWLEVYWVAVKDDGISHNQLYKKTNQAMAQRKLLRHFVQVQNETGYKCSLSGSQAALDIDWKDLRSKLPREIQESALRDSEVLGSLALVKRFAQERFNGLIDDVNFPSVEKISGRKDAPPSAKDEAYFFTFLHMDGDSMGTALGEQKTFEEHQTFSRKLSYFASDVEGMFNTWQQTTNKRAVLVYAGGDDVLALLPLEYVLSFALDIRNKFLGRMPGLTISAGIAITPDRLPFGAALEASRQMEKLAKGMEGKDALAIQERHGGQLRQARIKWDDLPLILDMQGYFAKDILSGKLAYDVQQLAHDMDGGEVKAEARAAELTRILKRRLADNIRAEDRDAVLGEAPKLAALGEKIGWAALANWLILARFLAKGGRE